MFSFTGNKRSFSGDANFYGKAVIKFFTQMKTITSRWKEPSVEGYKVSTSMPLINKQWKVKEMNFLKNIDLGLNTN